MCAWKRRMHQPCLFFFPTVITWCCFLFLFPLVVCGVPLLNTHQRHRPSVLVCLPGSWAAAGLQLSSCEEQNAEEWVFPPSAVELCGRQNTSHKPKEGLWHGRAAAWGPAEVPAPQPWVKLFLGLLELSGQLRLHWAMPGSWSIFEFHWASALEV